MPRILLLIILFWLLYHVLRRFVASADQSTASKKKNVEKIVQCANCGLRVPESESQIRNDVILCNNPNCQSSDSAKK